MIATLSVAANKLHFTTPDKRLTEQDILEFYPFGGQRRGLDRTLQPLLDAVTSG